MHLTVILHRYTLWRITISTFRRLTLASVPLMASMKLKKSLQARAMAVLELGFPILQVVSRRVTNRRQESLHRRGRLDRRFKALLPIPWYWIPLEGTPLHSCTEMEAFYPPRRRSLLTSVFGCCHTQVPMSTRPVVDLESTLELSSSQESFSMKSLSRDSSYRSDRFRKTLGFTLESLE